MSEWVITSSILILAIIMIRSCFRDKIALWARYALWMVVAVRLLVPLTFSESSFSVLNFLEWKQNPVEQPATDGMGHSLSAEPINAGESVQGIGYMGYVPETAVGVLSGGAAENVQSAGFQADIPGAADDISSGRAADAGGYVQIIDLQDASGRAGAGKEPVRAGDAGADGSAAAQTESRDNSRIHFGWKTTFFCIWIIGAAVFAGIVLRVNSRYRRRVYGTRRKFRSNVKSVLPVYFSSAVATPCMFGLFHPAVYLTPGIEGNEKALRYVLCHENTHYRHHDNFWAVVRAACLCLHWYNPLVWIAAEFSRQDCELACDEKTLKLLDEEDRIDYGRTLLDFSVQSDALPGGLQLSTAVSGGKKRLKERLMMIVGRPRRTLGSLAMTMALVMLASAVTFTGRVNGQEFPEDMAASRGKDAASADGETEGKGLGQDNSINGTEGSRSEDGGNAHSGKGGVSNTDIVSINLNDGKDYTLKVDGEIDEGNGEYRIGQMELNWIHDRMEETVQTISLEDVKVLYTRSLKDVRANGGQMWSYSSQKEALYAKPLCTADDLPMYAVEAFQEKGKGETLSELFTGSIHVADLNFDGYEDFYLQGKSDGENVPYYSYLWNPEERKFIPGYMIPNLRADQEAQMIVSVTDDGDDVYSTKCYRFDENGFLHMLSYAEENRSADAVFPALHLTYCEPTYALPAVDEWDYGTRYGGALTERFVDMAKEALTELYEWSGTKLDSICFAVTHYGEITFGNTPKDMDASRTFYDRCYGDQMGFTDCIRHMDLSTERVVWYSPVTQWNVPERLDQMTDEEVIAWYFERSELTAGETMETIEKRYEDVYVVKAESGNYYEIYIQISTREIGSIYGPYDGYPMH